MHDPVTMRGAQRVGDLDGVLQRLRKRNRTFAQPLGQRLAFEELHHEEVHALVRADVVYRADVGMVERGDGSRFMLEPTTALGISGDFRRQDLDCYGPAKARVAGLVTHPCRPRQRGRGFHRHPGAFRA